jgi:hypothetical protein
VTAEVTASATNGEVRLDVPEGSRFDLDAESRRGELSTQVPGLTASETGGQPGRAHRVAGHMAGGGPAVRLRADGDITLEAGAAGPIADRAVAKPAAVEPPPTPAAVSSTAATPGPHVPAEAAPQPPPPPSKPEAPEQP